MSASSAPRPKIPLTILTGFLGAGKTTLLNRILEENHGLQIAVIVNDFGAINIDAQLIVNVESDTIRLANGCVCCSIRGDLLATVLQLMERPDLPEYILIEASGVAEPAAVAHTFLNPMIRPFIQLDSIVTLVDAEQVRNQPDYAELIEDQIMAADIVVINKIDLVTENLRTGLREWIDLLVPNARVLEAMHARVPLELLLGVGPSVSHKPHSDHDHTYTFDTWSYESGRSFALEPLQRTLDTLPPTIFRAKGVLFVAESQRRIVLQLVGRRATLSRGEPWGDEQPHTQLVMIGSPGACDDESLSRLFDACLSE
ncbi:MAG: GTP-binding protein [Chloroflexota bacterium]